MPPFGLYSMPRNHLYGGRTKPMTYNSNDFQNDQGQLSTPGPALPANMNNAGEIRTVAGGSKEKKKAGKKGKKAKLLESDKNDELDRVLSEAKAMPFGENRIKGKKDKKKHRRSEEGAQLAKVSDITPIPPPKSQEDEENGAVHDRHSAKKRKRESEAHAEQANVQLLNEEYLAGQSLPADVLVSLRNFGPSTTRQSQPQTSHLQEQPSKKKKKRKSQNVAPDIQRNETRHEQSDLNVSIDEPKVRKTKRKSQAVIPDSPKEAATHVPVPSDRTGGSDEFQVKKHKNQGTIDQLTTPATPSPVPVSKRTPIPFPTLSQKSAFSPAGEVQHKDVKDISSSNVLVPETPPPTVSKITPVPLPPTLSNGVAATDHEALKKVSRPVVSTPTPDGGIPAPSTAPEALATSQVASKLPSVPNALTDANLRSFKEPLNERARPQARTKSGASTVTSVRTSSVPISIQEAFARVGKPYTRSAAEYDPFVTTSNKLKKARETHEEAPLDVFNEKYDELKKAVNFDEEVVYLKDHLEWDSTHNADPVPCLNKMTGCSAKKEELLRLSKGDNMEILAQLDTSKEDFTKLAKATNDAQRAEELLMMAIRARIPVPIGRIEGRWTLYCPKYAETHFDKYGYGQRNLVISSIAGFRHKNTFTARMKLPPRTMYYTILSFQTPPHASFRSITVKTASEGYTMDIVFMGNGFLHLRADLGRLLSGTIRKPNEDNYVMEFIGVHEKATDWWPEDKDEVEKEAKKLFAKYDGHAVGD